MEKDKLILKNKLEHVNKEVQNIGFAKDRINNKNQQLETIMSMTIENQKGLRERNSQLNEMLVMQQQAHKEKE